MHRILFLILVPLLGFTVMGCPFIDDDDDSAMDDDDSAMDDDDDSAVDDDDDSAAGGTCENAMVMVCGDALVDQTNAGGVSDFDAYSCADFEDTGPEAYYEFTPTETALVEVTMTPTVEDLDLIIVGNDAEGCDVEGDCMGSSQTSDVEQLQFLAEAGETYTFIVDGYDGITDTFDIDLNCEVEAYTFVAVRSLTATIMDLDDTNTPGPDLDAIELFDGLDSYWIEGLAHVQGYGGTVADGNVNEDIETVYGESDMFEADGITCVLDDDSGDARFWSMGSGDDTLGVVGWTIGKFDGGVTIEDGDLIEVYEVGSQDCDNLNVDRDDEYEVFIGLSSLDPTTMTVSDLEGAGLMSLGTTGAGGGVEVFDVNMP